MGPDRPTIPCVDIAPLVRGTGLGATAASDAERTAAASLDLAARSAGFFYVTGHGVGEDEYFELDGALRASKRLFALPDATKMSLRARGGEGAGYEPSGAQKLDEGNDSVRCSSSETASTARAAGTI